MSSIEFSVSDVLGRAWELTKKHGLVIALFYLVAGMVGSVISQVSMSHFMLNSWTIDPACQPDPEELLREMGSCLAVTPLLFLLQAALQTGLQNMLLTVFRGGQPDILAFKLPLRTYGYFILVSFLTYIIVYIGILCCIVPGIWLAIRLAYAPLWVLDHPDCTLEEALKGSWQMTRGHFWNIFGLGICSSLIACLGLLVCCIGVYFTAVIGGFAFVISYEILKPSCGSGDSENRFRSASPDVVPPAAPVVSQSERQAETPEEWIEKTLSADKEPESEGTSDAADENIGSSADAGNALSQEERPATVAPDGLCDVVLLNAGSDPEAVIRVIIGSVYGKGAAEVRASLEAVPVVLMEKVSVLQAERLKSSLEEAGAQVDIR